VKAVLAVARHEARRALATLDRRTGIGLAVVALLLASSWPIVQQNPVEPQQGLFPVAVHPESPLAGAVHADARFRVVEGGGEELRSGRVALVLGRDAVLHDGSERSQAALRALSQATQRWLEGRMASEADGAAAFPVQVHLALEPQDLSSTGAVSAGGGTSPGSTGGTGEGSARPLVEDVAVEPQLGLRPSEVEPPFPVRSLLLTFAFLIPMNLVAQLSAGSLMAERVRRRGLLVLTTPLSSGQVLLGRTLPHLALSLGILVVAGAAIGTGGQGFAAAVPMVLLVLAIAVVLGLLARSERELTFLLTAATTMLSTFLFLPAIFASLPPIAFLTPVSVVAASVDGVAVPWGRFLYATVPLSLCTVALALLSVGLYHEETLFSTRRLGDKVMEGLRRLVRSRWAALAGGILVVPFALALELFVLALVIPLGLAAAFPLFLLGVAAVEEGLKLLPARAHAQVAGGRAWWAGALAGAGFFLGEKIALLVSLAGFGLLPLGEPTLALWGIGGGLLLVAPLLLHAGCSAIAASATRRSRRWGLAAWAAAAALPAAYNALLLGGLS
jgi:ABC-type Na+ efflux pump permease subunit